MDQMLRKHRSFDENVNRASPVSLPMQEDEQES